MNMKRIQLLLTLLLLASPALAQSGLISGVVVVAQDEDGNTTPDVPIIVDGNPIGDTGDDGRHTIPIDTFDEGDTVEIFVAGGDDPTIYVDPEGENSCEDEKKSNDDPDDDDDCVAIGIFKWHPGILIVDHGDNPSSDFDRSRGSDGMDGDDEEDGLPVGVEIGIGYNLDWENVTFTIRGYWEEPADLPVDAQVGFDFFKPSSNLSVLITMIDVVYRHPLNMLASVYGGGGLRFIHQKYSFEGFSSSSNETGIALRGGATYDVGPVEVFGEGDLMFAYSSSIFEPRFGVRYGF